MEDSVNRPMPGMPAGELPELSEGSGPLRILIVEDHRLFRLGLRRMLEQRGMEVVGEAARGEDAIALATELEPDVVVMDLSLPGISGLETLRRLSSNSPHGSIVVLTVSQDEQDVLAAVDAGARGYLVKDATPDEIADGVRAAAAGEALLSPGVAGSLMTHLRLARLDQQAESEDPELSERELQVLRLLAAGMDNVGIADELSISPRTVKNHVSNIFAKLGVTNRIAAGIYAVRSGQL